MSERWTEQTERAVADYLARFPDETWASSPVEGARDILGMLAEAGLLVPPAEVVSS